MSWWIILIAIVAAVAAGAAIGIPISIWVEKRKEELFLEEWRKRKLADDNPRAVTLAPVKESVTMTGDVDDKNSKEAGAVVRSGKNPLHLLVDEVEKNLMQAREFSDGELRPFVTQSWSEKYEGNPVLPEYLQKELSRAYLEINLANNIAWLWTDLGSKNPELNRKYADLCVKIADTLDKIRPLLGS